MKNLKDLLFEGLLSDMEDTLKVGNNFDKQYKKMRVEIENMQKTCSSVNNNRWVHDTYEFDPQRYPNTHHQGTSKRYYNIVDCPHIFKHYGSTYKSLIIKLDFTPMLKGWSIEIGATRQTTKNWAISKGPKQSVIYRIIESKYEPGPGNGPTVDADTILQDYVLPLISDIDALYENVIKTCVETKINTSFKEVITI